MKLFEHKYKPDMNSFWREKTEYWYHRYQKDDARASRWKKEAKKYWVLLVQKDYWIVLCGLAFIEIAILLLILKW